MEWFTQGGGGSEGEDHLELRCCGEDVHAFEEGGEGGVGGADVENFYRAGFEHRQSSAQQRGCYSGASVALMDGQSGYVAGEGVEHAQAGNGVAAESPEAGELCAATHYRFGAVLPRGGEVAERCCGHNLLRLNWGDGAAWAAIAAVDGVNALPEAEQLPRFFEAEAFV